MDGWHLMSVALGFLLAVLFRAFAPQQWTSLGLP
jgi:hypothetical protein